jgi:hypothetical protein
VEESRKKHVLKANFFEIFGMEELHTRVDLDQPLVSYLISSIGLDQQEGTQCILLNPDEMAEGFTYIIDVQINGDLINSARLGNPVKGSVLRH